MHTIINTCRSNTGTGPISFCLKRVLRNLESDLSMFVHSCQKSQKKKKKKSSSSFDMRQHRNSVELRILNPCTARCKTHLICLCEVVEMKVCSSSEKNAVEFQNGTKISLIMKQNTLEKLRPSEDCLSKDAKIRLYEPFHRFEFKNSTVSSALLCTDLCEYVSH